MLEALKFLKNKNKKYNIKPLKKWELITLLVEEINNKMQTCMNEGVRYRLKINDKKIFVIDISQNPVLVPFEPFIKKTFPKQTTIEALQLFYSNINDMVQAISSLYDSVNESLPKKTVEKTLVPVPESLR